MEALDLYLFLDEHDIAMRWDDEELSTWIPADCLSDFTDLISSSLSDGGMPTQLMENGIVWIDLVPVCEYYGIEPEKIFPKT